MSGGDERGMAVIPEGAGPVNPLVLLLALPYLVKWHFGQFLP